MKITLRAISVVTVAMLVACNGDEGVDMEDMPPSALGLLDEGVGGSLTSGGAGGQGGASTSGGVGGVGGSSTSGGTGGVGGSLTGGGAGGEGGSSTSGSGGGASCVADVSEASLGDGDASLDVEMAFAGAAPNNCAGQRITIYYTNANYFPAVDAAKAALDTACIAAGCAGGDYSTIGACRNPPGPWEAYGSYQPGNKAACRP